jgi:hypothetical protein
MSIIGLLRSFFGLRDVVYASISNKEVPLYQRYFEEMLENADLEAIKALTEIARTYKVSEGFTARIGITSAYAIERVKLRPILLRAEDEDGLDMCALAVIFDQFFFADPGFRHLHRGNWASTVIHTRESRFFPRADDVLKNQNREILGPLANL